MKVRKTYFFISSMVLVIFLVTLEIWIESRNIEKAEVKKAITASDDSRKPAVATAPHEVTKAPTNKNLSIRDQIAAWSEQVGQVQENPQVIEDSLNQFSASLKPHEMEDLAFIIKKSNQQDQRFLSVELLARSKNLEAKKILKELALSPETPREKSNPDLKAEENTLRMRAVEGLMSAENQETAKSLLREVRSRTQNSFVSDRSERALHHLEKGGATPEAQDQEALQKFVNQ